MHESDNPYVVGLLKVLNAFGKEIVQVYEFSYPNEVTKHYLVRSTDKETILFESYSNKDFVRMLEYLSRQITTALNLLENNKEK